MSNDVLDMTLNRRTILAGIAFGSALVPTMALAEGGLKGSSADDSESTPDDDSGHDDRLAELGVTGEHSYESPTFGYELEWDPTWTVLLADPGEVSATEEWDIFRLEWAELAGEEATMLEFNGFAAPPENVESWLEGMSDPETLSGFFGGGTREVQVALVERDGDMMEVVWTLGDSPGENDAVQMVCSYRVLEEGLLLMSAMAITDPDLVSGVVADLIDGVTLNGEPLFALLTVDAIEDAFASLT